MREIGKPAQKPKEVHWFSLLKLGGPILNGRDVPPEIIPLVVSLLIDTDGDITENSRQVLTHLSNPSSIKALSELWDQGRSPVIRDVIISACHVPEEPESLRLKILLLQGKIDQVRKVQPKSVWILFGLRRDPDPQVQTGAYQALSSLDLVDSQEEVCAIFLETDDPGALEIAVSSGYRPKDPTRLALFYFLSGQFERFDELDFDLRLLRAVYQSASGKIRHRMAQQIQKSGKLSYLSIVSSGAISPCDYTDEEVATWISIYSNAARWDSLWDMVIQVRIESSLKILSLLDNSSWNPPEDTLPYYRDFLRYRPIDPKIFSSSYLKDHLPLLSLHSTLNVKGRVNCMDFHPGKSQIAIGSNSRKVALWNIEEGSLAHKLDGFKHSISKLIYLNSGDLVIGEKAFRNEKGGLYQSNGEKVMTIGSHTGSITALAPFGENQFISAGRDQTVILWDEMHHPNPHRFDFWCRDIVVSKHTRRAILLHDTFTMVTLPEFQEVQVSSPRRRNAHSKPSVLCCAAFSQDDRWFLTGAYSGQIHRHNLGASDNEGIDILPSKFRSPITGIVFLPISDMMAVTTLDGTLIISTIGQPNRNWSYTSPLKSYTSLKVSPNGHFLATGTRDSLIQIWNQEHWKLPALFATPIGKMTLDDIKLLAAFQDSNDIPESIRSGLHLLKKLLEYRFRYAIMIQEKPSLHATEYDIELE
ncbi:MAG TPA: hypothetical protein VIO61_11735 [Anaerolineaceae bacterium]